MRGLRGCVQKGIKQSSYLTFCRISYSCPKLKNKTNKSHEVSLCQTAVRTWSLRCKEPNMSLFLCSCSQKRNNYCHNNDNNYKKQP